MGGEEGKVQVMRSKGCSRLFGDISSSLSSFRGLQSFEPISPASTSTSSVSERPLHQSRAPFSGIVICVTGLSKEARKQVKDATEGLGGQAEGYYSRSRNEFYGNIGGDSGDIALESDVY
ncbi:hypothetical protein U1Q18_036741 [Sarracenia purpurea var. burkii]